MMITTEVWKILARYEVGGEENLIDFATSKNEAERLAHECQLLHGPYAVIRAEKVRRKSKES